MWGETILTIATNFDIPLFEEALETFSKACLLKPSSHRILRMYAVALSKYATYLSRHGGTINNCSSRDLDHLSEGKMTKALVSLHSYPTHSPSVFQAQQRQESIVLGQNPLWTAEADIRGSRRSDHCQEIGFKAGRSSQDQVLATMSVVVGCSTGFSHCQLYQLWIVANKDICTRPGRLL